MAGRYPDYLSPNGPKLTKAQKSRARREPSGVFSLFQPSQIQQFKEAFSLIDQDRDGVVSERDLKEIFSSLGMFLFAYTMSAIMTASGRYHAHKADAR